MERRGFKPERTRSPAYEKRNRHRRHDTGTDEIIRFVRERQLERQPTILRLQKKAPLPDIGQLPPLGVQDSGFIDKPVEDSYSEEYDVPDDEVMAIEQNAGILCASPVGNRRSDFRSNKSLGSKSFQSFPSRNDPSRLSNRSLNKSFNGRYIRVNRLLNPLPPLMRRDELPVRPSAPSPSVTPPLPGHEDELDSAGEPIDFIDPA
ncbi:hypothetical protein LOTGIDRAFT_161345 [Lottia gigantea]|uniref:Uncharacterized protein n=1 Tax=Lottia gigantea TaxID=225164 RepID=V4AG50_LOTGI|nr:hypothetical protein LOTGIDRAFT_161345 [Lottia gigantea]ESO94145.1 hypothetical protein LOTGIDRAFT_161345 [Lottia gigantea]